MINTQKETYDLLNHRSKLTGRHNTFADSEVEVLIKEIVTDYNKGVDNVNTVYYLLGSEQNK